jgi:hypothetical protein
MFLKVAVTLRVTSPAHHTEHDEPGLVTRSVTATIFLAGVI